MDHFGNNDTSLVCDAQKGKRSLIGIVYHELYDKYTQRSHQVAV